jgi:adenosylcobinamide-phosphate synthase
LPLILTLAGLILDSLIGDPREWPHPVRFIGALIVAVEKWCFRVAARWGVGPKGLIALGGLLALAIIAPTVLIVWLILVIVLKISTVLWFAVSLYFIFTIFCLKDLGDHVKRVEGALSVADLEEARRALSWIVGRDTANLSPADIRRATVETIAENFSDGLVAPLMYLALGGPVLAWGYKAINTLDSMVGYKNERYLYLGRFSARLDDVANYLPSRLAALLLILGAKILGLDAASAFRLWRKEGSFHSSPNSGQTEATMAGALSVYLGGPNHYGGELVQKPIIGRDLVEVTEQSVHLALKLVKVATLLALLLALAFEAVLLYGLNWSWGWA